MKGKIIIVLSVLLFFLASFLGATSFSETELTLPDGFTITSQGIHTNNVLMWSTMNTDPNVITNLERNIHLLDMPSAIRNLFLERIDSLKIVSIDSGERFKGMICGGKTSSYHKIHYGLVITGFNKPASAKMIEVILTYEEFNDLDINPTVYKAYKPENENQELIFKIYFFEDGLEGKKQCNNLCWNYEFRNVITREITIRDTITLRDTVRIEKPFIRNSCSEFSFWNGWVEWAGTWLREGAINGYNEFVGNYNNGWNPKESYDYMGYINYERGNSKGRFTTNVCFGNLDRSMKFNISSGYHKIYRKKYHLKFGLLYEARHYSFYKRYYDSSQETYDYLQKRVILHYPAIYLKFRYEFGKKNSNILKSIKQQLRIASGEEKARLQRLKNILLAKAKPKSYFEINGYLGPNSQLFGTDKLKVGSWGVGLESKLEWKWGLNWYNYINLEYKEFKSQKVIFLENNSNSIKEKGEEIYKYAHLRMGIKSSQNSIVFGVFQYLEDQMNDPNIILSDKFQYIRKDAGVGFLFKIGKIEPNFIFTKVWIEDIYDNDGWGAKITLNF